MSALVFFFIMILIALGVICVCLAAGWIVNRFYVTEDESRKFDPVDDD